MPRIARQYEKAMYYHVMVQGINREYIFKDNVYKSIYLKQIYENTQKFDIKIVAYCIMDNHAHLVLKPNDVLKLSKCMQKINLKFSIMYNSDNNRVRLCV